MEYYAGIDVSLKDSSVCVVDATGKVVCEVKVASEPEALVRYFDELGLPVSRIGLEAGPLSQWLHVGLIAADHDDFIAALVAKIRFRSRHYFPTSPAGGSKSSAARMACAPMRL